MLLEKPEVKLSEQLVLYDMPGLIHAVEDGGNKANIRTIRNLTLTHIRTSDIYFCFYYRTHQKILLANKQKNNI